MGINKLLTISLIALLVQAHSPVSEKKKYPKYPPSTASVVIYDSPTQISGKYEIVGKITIISSGIADDYSLKTFIKKAQKKCQDLGGNAIIIEKIVSSDVTSICYRLNALAVRINYETMSEKTSETEESLKQYFSSVIDPLEGIYKSFPENSAGYYKIGIKKQNDKYIAIVIDSDVETWKPGEIIGYFEPTSMPNIYSLTWLQFDKTKSETFCKQIANGSWETVLKKPDNEKVDVYFIKLYPKLIPNNTQKKKNQPDIEKSSGSGFAITKNGLIATNAHVIEGAKRTDVTFNNDSGQFTYTAKILICDKPNDIALLQIEDKDFKGFPSIPYRIVEEAETGEAVFTIGYPLNTIMGANYKVTNGIISAQSGVHDDVRYYQTSVPIQAGNSGGPLFNKKGNVIGLTTAKLSGKEIGQNIENVNYAIKSLYLLNICKIQNVNQLSNNQISAIELEQQIKILKNYVCLIRVY